MIDTPQAKRWMERLLPRTGLHGSKPECFENALGKLTMLGLRAGCPELDQRTASFRAWLETPIEDPLSGSFYRSLVASFLLLAGSTDQAVLAEVRRRLDRISAFVRPGWREPISTRNPTPTFRRPFAVIASSTRPFTPRAIRSTP